MHEQKSYGLLIEPPSETDYVAGDGNLSGEVINPEGDWLPFIPVNEHQAPQFETNACASFGTLNAFEMLHKSLFGEEMNLSDRMLAKGSNTDPAKGNSPQKVSEWFRKNWSALQEDWPMDGVQSTAEYYAPLPDLLFSKAKIVQGDGVWGYEAITNSNKLKLKDALTKGTVCISVKAWAQDENGLYYAPPQWTDNHWTTLLNIRPDGNFTVLDSYSPYIKIVRGDHIPAIAYRYTLNEVQVDGIIAALKALIKKISDYLATKPVEPAVVKPVPKEVLLNAMCMAIRKHEGWILNPPSRSVRNNNPGNIKYLSQDGTIGKDDKGFAIFKDYETGFAALKRMILNAAKGFSKVYHPTDNLFDFFGKYAPSSDNNNPVRYAEVVAKAMNVNPATFRLSNLL